MINKVLKNQKILILITSLYLVLFILAIYPGTGGEGGQRDLQLLSEKIDWWNFFPAFIYGNWPNNFLPWRYTLGVFQILLFLIGIILIYRKLSLSSSKILIIILTIIFLFFVAQVLRDASMLSVYTFSVGLLLSSESKQKRKQFILLFLSLVTAIIGALFRPIFAPLFAILYVILIRKVFVYRFNKIALVLIFTSIAIFPWKLDQELSNKFDLQKSFPQQQVMIYDLAKLGCWGHSKELTEFALESLDLLLRERYDYESVCASLTPAGWDHLRSRINDVKNSPVLSRISNGKVEQLKQLQENWINSIGISPYEWLLIKSVDLSQVMLMANTFYSPEFFSTTQSNFLFNIADRIIKIPYTGVSITDKLRFFSILFTIIVGVLLLMFNRTKNLNFTSFYADVNIFIIINLLLLVWLSIAYVANNGRYSAPFTFLAYIYLILARDINIKKL